MFHKFTYKEDDEMGYSGWVLDAKPYFDPMSGRGVAHDVLEEMPHGGEQPHDELMALGAMLFGRGSMSKPSFMSQFSWDESLAHEFSPLFSHAFNEEGYYLASAPNTLRLDKGRCGECHEREEAIIQAIAPRVLKYIESYGVKEWGDNPDNLEEAKQWIPHAQNWIRIGFRRARRRFYPYMNGEDVAYMFERIENEVSAIKGVELFDRLTIRLRRQINDFTLWHTPNYELIW